MFEGRIFIIILVLVLRYSLALAKEAGHLRPIQPKVRSSTSTILNEIGYLAEDHYLSVQDGLYTLNLVKVTNPLVANRKSVGKYPLLFIHGLLTNANAFLQTSGKPTPKNHVTDNLSTMNEEELLEVLGQDVGSQSLVYLALNIGHEVWLLNRRTTGDSRTGHFARLNRRGHAGNGRLNNLESADNTAANLRHFPKKNKRGDITPTEYWNFSLDEQATYDIPSTIEYILDQSGKQKLNIVGFSAGATITMMSLTNQPKLANKSKLL